MPQMDKITYYSQILWNLFSSTFFYILIIMVLFVSLCIIIFKYFFNLFKNNQTIYSANLSEPLSNNKLLTNFYNK